MKQITSKCSGCKQRFVSSAVPAAASSAVRGPGVLAAPQASAARGAGPGPRGLPGPRGFPWPFLRRFRRAWRGLPRSAAARAGRGHGQGSRVDAAAPVKAEAASPRNPLSAASVGYEPGHSTHTRQGSRCRLLTGSCRAPAEPVCRELLPWPFLGNAVCHTWIVNQAVQGR